MRLGQRHRRSGARATGRHDQGDGQKRVAGPHATGDAGSRLGLVAFATHEVDPGEDRVPFAAGQAAASGLGHLRGHERPVEVARDEESRRLRALGAGDPAASEDSHRPVGPRPSVAGSSGAAAAAAAAAGIIVDTSPPNAAISLTRLELT